MMVSNKNIHCKVLHQNCKNACVKFVNIVSIAIKYFEKRKNTCSKTEDWRLKNVSISALNITL